MQVFTLNIFIKLSLLLACAFLSRVALGQAGHQQIELSCAKTSSVIFPCAIKSVDRGSRDLMAQKATGVENVLQLKAARRYFPETNLTVITAEGQIHQFRVIYCDEPDSLVVPIGNGVPGNAIFDVALTEDDMERYASAIVLARPTVKFKRSEKYDTYLSLKGIYVKDNVIFYHLRIDNNSALNYNVEYLRFFIRDQKKAKRTATQDISLKPVYVFGNDRLVEGREYNDVVYALDKFTIPDAKKLVIELYEKSGGRHLKLNVHNRQIIKARLLP